MNGFADRGLDDSNFGGNGAALTAVRAFDAFPKTKPSYTQRTTSGGVWTLGLVVVSLLLVGSEVSRWWVGETTHAFNVEQGVGHDLQINLDFVVRMKCEDLRVNVQDVAGDRILAGLALSKDPTIWSRWDAEKHHGLGTTQQERLDSHAYREDDVHDYLSASRNRKKIFKKTPRVPRKYTPDSCRIFGSIDGNKVQGDFHITARGHGYVEMREHLDHQQFNFSHHINELSFGPYYPSLINPLDDTVSTAPGHFHKFQYFLSVVPTIYTTDRKAQWKTDKHAESPSSGEDGMKHHPARYSRNTIFTNQYAVTEQSKPLTENMIPGIFVMYDVEPIQLTITEEWISVPALLIRIVNVISGIVVAAGWGFQISEWAREIAGRRRKGRESGGVLHGGLDEKRGL